MKTSWTEISTTEKYLKSRLSSEDQIVFERKLATDEKLRQHVKAHKQVHFIVRLFQRRRVKQQLENIHREIFNDPAKTDYQTGILKLFKS